MTTRLQLSEQMPHVALHLTTAVQIQLHLFMVKMNS